MKYLIVFILLVTSLTASAGEAVYLEANKPAPWSGYLISQETADSIRNNKIDLDATRKILSLTQDENKLLELRISNANGEIDRLSKHLVSERGDNFFNKVGYFVLGAVITGAIAYGTVRSLR